MLLISSSLLAESFCSQAVKDRKACFSGDARACYKHAQQLISGQCVHKEVGKGIALLRRSCADGYKFSCYELSHVSLNGDKYLKRACELGLGIACKDYAQR